MFAVALAVISIAGNPPDAAKAAARSLHARDYRIAGVSTFWGSIHVQKADWRPYGLKCRPLPETAYAYGYFVSDAIDHDAFDGYHKQILFLRTYNRLMLRSGRLPKEWNCTIDTRPGRLG